MRHDPGLSDLVVGRDSGLVRVARKGQHRETTAADGGFRHQFSCNCWPLMVRIIWWALRNRG